MSVVPPVSGFWRRFAAFFLDGILLGVVGQILFLTMASFWFRIGPYGRLAGALISLAYFAVLNSRHGGGHTPGKRALGILVVDRNNQTIGLGRSTVRTLIWLVPATLNGWALPIFGNLVLMWLVGAVVVGVGGAVVFTMLFNGRTRQGLHDLVCGTFVVRDVSDRLEAFPTVSRMPWIASAVILALAIIMPPIGMMFLTNQFGGTLAQMMTLQKLIQHDTRFFSASVLDQTLMARGTTTHMLNINAWYKGRPSEELQQQLMNDIAKTALQSVEGIERYDRMIINITAAYDLGIATGRLTWNDSQPIHTWRERVLTTPSPAPARE
jgi:uncharacterized RDD family membrane protein YckC